MRVVLHPKRHYNFICIVAVGGESEIITVNLRKVNHPRTYKLFEIDKIISSPTWLEALHWIQKLVTKHRLKHSVHRIWWTGLVNYSLATTSYLWNVVMQTVQARTGLTLPHSHDWSYSATQA